MARVTVEDCIDKIPHRYDLVLVAAQRAKAEGITVDLGCHVVAGEVDA